MAASDLEGRLAALSPHQRRLLDQRLDRRHREQSIEPVAVVGIACRFPGADSPAELLQLLRQGRDAVSEVPAERWDLDNLYDADPQAPGKMSSRWGGFLRQIDRFDCGFFGISPREAVQMDPQQRLLLEVGWEALEDAGIAPASLAGSDTGVFVGIMTGDYGQTRYGSLATVDAYSGPGNSYGMTANRLSYHLDLRGPSLAVDTACSSSLVAVHQACRSLRSGESGLALAGGVNVLLWPGHTIYFTKAGLMATDGRCKTFDARADGIVRGEGAGIVVLKTLSRARADGDCVLALIRGSAVNQDGRSNGLTAPHGAAQEAVLRSAYRDAGCSPGQVQYVEAHGTGTALGDPVEMQALGAVLARDRPAQQRCAVGSIKTNFGHLEAAAGIAGLIKTVLGLRHREIFPHLHFQRPNPEIPFERLPLRVPTRREPWPDGAPSLAGVSAFGFGGTNAHLVLEAAPPEPERTPAEGGRPRHLLALSARSDSALRELGRRYGTRLRGSGAGGRRLELADVCFTANTGRNIFRHHLAVHARSATEMGAKLEAFADGQEVKGLVSGQATAEPRIAFLFTGQGSQSVGMGRGLYETEPVFRRALQRCDEILRPHLKRPLLSVMYPQAGKGTESLLEQTAYAQPALCALEHSLVELWRSWGIEPSAVLGHSVGEYSAAGAAGVFSIEDTLRLVAERGRLMQELPAGGAMVAAQLSEEDAAEYLTGLKKLVSIAAVNGPRSVVLSGDWEALAEIVDRLGSEGVETRLLRVSHAFHSPLMEPALEDFRRVLRGLAGAAPRIDLISNLTGEPAAAELFRTPDYWCDHARQPVRFAAGIETLLNAGWEIFVEIGPLPTLIGMAGRFVPTGNAWLPSLREGVDDWETMLGSLGELHVRGASVNWHGFDRSAPRRRVSLPTYPFERQRYWLPTSSGQEGERIPPPGRRLRSPALGKDVFESWQDPGTMPWLDDHRIGGRVVVPGAGHLASALTVAEGLGPGAPGIEDLTFLRPLTTGDGEARIVQLIHDRDSGELEIFSRPPEEDVPWTLHATGRLLSVAGEPSPIDLSEVRARCLEELDPETFCAETGRGELRLGPAMQWLGEIRRRRGEALACIRPPDGEKYRPPHPGLIDSCIRLLAATLPDRDRRTFYLPFRTSRCRLHRPAEGDLWCHATLRSDAEASDLEIGDRITGDIRLVDTDGRLVLGIEGLEIRRADLGSFLTPTEEEPRRWLYELEWRLALAPEVRDRRSLADPQPGRWLIFADELGLGEALATQLRRTGGRTVVVLPGKRTECRRRGRWRLDPERADDFWHMFEEMGDDGSPWEGVVHLWNLQPESPRGLKDAKIHGLESLFHLGQALRSAGDEVPRTLWLVTRGAQATGEDGAGAEVSQAPAWGLGGVLTRELPGWRCVCVDLDPRLPDNDAERESEVHQLAAELLAPDGEDRIALRGDERRVARLLPAGRPLSPQDRKTLAWAEGTYLITGGLGSLGLHVAGWLAELGSHHLVLAGRRPPSELARKKIEEIERCGARVVVRGVNVARPDEVAALIADIGASMPPLRGIFHAAGLVDDCLLARQDWLRFHRVLAPKVDGAWNLHQETRELELDLFVMFSSTAPLLCPPGQGSYAAANAFLDALAHHRRTLGQHALSINWGPWSESGMAAEVDEDIHLRWRKAGIQMIEPAQGLELMGRLLEDDATQIAVLPIDRSKLSALYPNGALPPLLAEVLGRPSPRAMEEPSDEQPPQPPNDHRLELSQRLEGTSEDAWHGLLTQHVLTEARRILRLTAEQPLAAEDSLFAVGLDSLMAIELRNALQKDIRRPLPGSLVFDQPTAERLAIFLAVEMSGASASEASAAEERDANRSR